MLKIKRAATLLAALVLAASAGVGLAGMPGGLTTTGGPKSLSASVTGRCGFSTGSAQPRAHCEKAVQ